MTNPYPAFVSGFERLLRQGPSLALGGLPMPQHRSLPVDAPKVLLFSPHPDDEVITGALPLRLLRQTGMRVINVAVTLGSNKARQSGRWQELQACCGYAGFEVIATTPTGLEGVNLKTRDSSPAAWRESVRCIAQLLAQHQPRVIFLPHAGDWNSTHVGTHHLVMDALGTLGPGFACYTVETEYWGAMSQPNLMVESSEADVADLITALSFHAGEVQRNPYHIRLPAWLIDNVRRGGELVGGQGAAAPSFAFATLYRQNRWQQGHLAAPYEGGKILAAAEDPGKLFTPTA